MLRIIFLLFFVVVQTGCYSLHLNTQNNDPIIQLEQRYSLRLDASLNTEHAQKIFDFLDSTIPQDLNLSTSIWNLGNNTLNEDINLKTLNGVDFVTLSREMFSNEQTQDPLQKDKRLYYAIVRFITENGTNRTRIEQVLNKRYGIIVDIPSYATLTQNSTKESSEHFSEFKTKDLMILISILEEFPKSIHKIPQLRYIVQRIDDEIRAPGVAWTSEGYMEISEKIFSRDFDDDTRRLIAHEKTHFLWEFVFTDQLKQDWTNLSGWFEDPKSESGWSNTKDKSEFVSNYAYENNPNEDMAESLGYYLVYPDKLRSCSSEKYEFIHNRIILMYRHRYISIHSM